MREPTLRKNTAWAVTGNVVFAGGRFLTLVLLWKFLPSAQVGQAILALAIVTPISLFLNLGLRLIIATDTTHRFQAGTCLTTRILSHCLLALILVALCLMQSHSWSLEKIAVILLAGLVRALENWVDIYLAVMQKHERMKNVSISQIMKVSLVLICAAVFAPLTKKAIWIFLGWALAVALIGILYDRKQAARWESVKLVWSKTISWQLVCLGLPLGIFITITSFNERISLYFIEYEFGDRFVAYFSTFLAFIAGLGAIQNGMNQAVLPRLSQYFLKNPKKFIPLLGRVLLCSWGIMACFLAVVWWQPEAILRCVAKPEYTQYADIFIVVAFGGSLLLTGMILGDAVVACQRFKSRMCAVALGLIANVILCWIYIPRYGMSAAAWAFVASAALTSMTCGAILGDVFRKKSR